MKIYRDGPIVLFDMYTYEVYITRRKGPSENRQEGEDGDNYIMYMYVLYILLGGRGRAGAGRRGKTVTTVNCFLYCVKCNCDKAK